MLVPSLREVSRPLERLITLARRSHLCFLKCCEWRDQMNAEGFTSFSRVLSGKVCRGRPGQIGSKHIACGY